MLSQIVPDLTSYSLRLFYVQRTDHIQIKIVLELTSSSLAVSRAAKPVISGWDCSRTPARLSLRLFILLVME